MKTVWEKHCSDGGVKQIKGEITCDAAVIGGGMCGMLTAYKLSRAGLKTVLLEEEKIGSGQSAGTTAKITLCHDAIFTKLEDKLNRDYAKLYAQNEAESIEEYENIINRENVSCDFERVGAVLYSLYGERLIKAEYEAAREAGLECEMRKETELPFDVAAALEFRSQAQFHPLKFIHGLKPFFDVYENTGVHAIENGTLLCDSGVVRAKYIVIATNYPVFYDLKRLYPLRIHRKMAHVCTFDGTEPLASMYIGIDGGYNYRSYGDKLIVSGESHISGCGVPGAYDRIEKCVKENFSDAVSVGRWSAEDAETLDTLPCIERLRGSKATVFTVTGFGTWGMTSSMSAARLICDMICGRYNKAEAMYSPKRFKLRNADELGGMISRATSGIFLSKLKNPEDELSDLPKGSAKIVNYRGNKVAAYRDEDGEVHICRAYCPHLKCELKWNPDDKTWDCACHGSRFDADGVRIAGPADIGISM